MNIYRNPRIVKLGDEIQPCLSISTEAYYQFETYFPSIPVPISFDLAEKITNSVRFSYYKDVPNDFIQYLVDDTPKKDQLEETNLMFYLRAGIIVAPSYLETELSYIRHEGNEQEHQYCFAHWERYRKIDLSPGSVLSTTTGFGVLLYDEVNKRPRVYHLEKRGQDLFRGEEWNYLTENAYFTLRLHSYSNPRTEEAPKFLSPFKEYGIFNLEDTEIDEKKTYLFALMDSIRKDYGSLESYEEKYPEEFEILYSTKEAKEHGFDSVSEELYHFWSEYLKFKSQYEEYLKRNSLPEHNDSEAISVSRKRKRELERQSSSTPEKQSKLE